MHIVVIGLGRFGAKLATALFDRGGEVTAIDSSSEAVERIKDRVTRAVIADCTDEVTMRDLELQDADVAVLAIGEKVETAIIATAILRRLGVCRIMSRAMSPIQRRILEEVGAHEVFSLEERMGEQMAERLIAPHVLERLILSSGHSLVEMRPRQDFVGHTLVELNLRARMGINVIAIKRRVPALDERGQSTLREVINDLPKPDDIIKADDILVLVGPDDKIQELSRSIAAEVAQ